MRVRVVHLNKDCGNFPGLGSLHGIRVLKSTPKSLADCSAGAFMQACKRHPNMALENMRVAVVKW